MPSSKIIGVVLRAIKFKYPWTLKVTNNYFKTIAKLLTHFSQIKI